MRVRVIFALFLLSTHLLNAQAYFQQDVKYTIQVSLDTTLHVLNGNIRIEYKNNSKTDLGEIYFHLWPNAYKNNTTELAKQFIRTGNKDFLFSDSLQRGFIDKINFTSPSGIIKSEILENGEVIKLTLDKVIKSGELTYFETPFRVKIPDSRFSRLGFSNKSYQLTQWYPKPAVFDKDGWHKMPYLNQGEFYSEYGSFNVEISVPENYIVAASGLVFDENKPQKSNGSKKYTIQLDNVHDFAWFASKNYVVQTDTLLLSTFQRPIIIQAYFQSENKEKWSKANFYTKRALRSYSDWIGHYPYEVCTVVDGDISAGAGMEYPTITVLTHSGNEKAFDVVITHEVGHNWFYGILGSNERDLPWMDEGINSYFEKRYTTTYYPVENNSSVSNYFGLTGKSINQNKLIYQILYSNNYNQPLCLHSKKYTNFNYGGTVYGSTAMYFDYLESILGRNEIDKCFQAYFNTWKFKHPYPTDIKSVFEATSGKKLDFFFDEMLTKREGVDYKIVKLNNETVKIKNKSSIAAPFKIYLNNNGKIQSLDIEGFTDTKTIQLNEPYQKAIIDPYYALPDVNRNNNTLYNRSIFKKIEPIKVRLIANSKFNPGNYIFALPTAGYNAYNGAMAGVALHNLSLNRNPFEWYTNSMYGFGNNGINHKSFISYHFKPHSESYSTISISALARYLSISDNRNLFQLIPSLSYEFFPYGIEQQKSMTIEYRSFNNQIQTSVDKTNHFINQLEYTFRNHNKIKPFLISVTNEFTQQYLKNWISIETSRYYTKKKKYFVRAFAGIFSWKNGDVNTFDFDARFRLSSFRGFQDYQYDRMFLGRNEFNGLLSNQISIADGGFINSGFLGQSWDYLTALNLKIQLPIPLPINAFFNVGHYKNEEPDRKTLLYEGGLSITVIKSICEIYFPILYSDPIKDALKIQNTSTFSSQIRFTFALEKLRPETLLNKIKTID